jgi:hypothetical protein
VISIIGRLTMLMRSNKTPDEKYWWIDLNLSADTSLYTFQYLVDGKKSG